ncbi:hypothetical protein BU26DRAFT_299185 [Trematosphaeria pertusa]|uniref:Uncharacterized protein n=1 Tax=Trematosphaeria pertusa TaxID=390896 RepID=A0A6A6IIU4_9PLEO|nr:uncharacterized protein BU26DRAFT_299185 [Trematosphaeria pertusa]KAF2250296.1 hypothetical protein BU26DRAFT_299185 [Trematosphaeria pertusa]
MGSWWRLETSSKRMGSSMCSTLLRQARHRLTCRVGWRSSTPPTVRGKVVAISTWGSTPHALRRARACPHEQVPWHRHELRGILLALRVSRAASRKKEHGTTRTTASFEIGRYSWSATHRCDSPSQSHRLLRSCAQLRESFSLGARKFLLNIIICLALVFPQGTKLRTHAAFSPGCPEPKSTGKNCFSSRVGAPTWEIDDARRSKATRQNEGGCPRLWVGDLGAIHIARRKPSRLPK